MINIKHIDINNKTVFLRTDLNAPLANGAVSDTSRIYRSCQTIRYIVKNNGKLIIASHLGQPNNYDKKYSLEPIAALLSTILGINIPIINYNNSINHKIVMLENTRFNNGEYANSHLLGQYYANLCDIFCYDAFATIHRTESSNNAVMLYAKQTCIGHLMEEELLAISSCKEKPILAIVGGSKISTKLPMLKNIAKTIDGLIVGGGILNCFLLALGYDIGKSLVEHKLLKETLELINILKIFNISLFLPEKVVVVKSIDDKNPIQKHVENIAFDDIILDIVPTDIMLDAIFTTKTIIWNGPLGMIEVEAFANGTKEVANAISKSNAFSFAGGGDTIFAINKLQIKDINYISTGGGALLKLLSGDILPTLELLNQKASLT